jgi:hypothetical protein
MPILDSLLQQSFWNILLVSTTIIGAFGGFPQPPKIFQAAAEYQIVQWILVYILAYQGGAGQDPIFALAATLATMVLYKGVRALESNDANELAK